MPHITLPPGVPGIGALLRTYPDSARPIKELAQVLLRGPSSLTPAERELIGTYVSAGNECSFCTNSHAYAARHLLGDQAGVVDTLLNGDTSAGLDEKMQALLNIAGKVRKDGRSVTDADVARARAAGADDRAIHDTVLISAMFCMANRYVEGLATEKPRDLSIYDEMGADLAKNGYA